MKRNSIEIDSGSDVEFEGDVNQYASEIAIPAKSIGRYNQIYTQFQKWKASKDITSNSEAILMTYFEELGINKLSTSLYSSYSMLKATMIINDSVDIASYHMLTKYLKEKSVGHKPKRAKIFTEDEIERFIKEAPDEAWLDVKVVCIFGVCGACRTHELPLINVEHVTKYDDMFLVTPPSKTMAQQSFTITGKYFNIVKKYADMRPSHAVCDNFFLNFRNAKCTIQTVGKNKIFKMPQRIATYLNLPEPERYTGHSLRKTSASISGTTKRRGNRISKRVADDSIKYKKRTRDTSSVAASDNSFENLNDPFGNDTFILDEQHTSAPATSKSFLSDKFVVDDSHDCFINLIDPLGDIISDLDNEHET